LNDRELTAEPLVTIVVVPREQFGQTRRSLESIFANTRMPFALVIVVLVGVAIIGFIAFMEQAQRRIPVQYAKRMVGRRMYGGTSTYIPMKVNQAGVIPVIFASSMLYIPQLAAQLGYLRLSGYRLVLERSGTRSKVNVMNPATGAIAVTIPDRHPGRLFGGGVNASASSAFS